MANTKREEELVDDPLYVKLSISMPDGLLMRLDHYREVMEQKHGVPFRTSNVIASAVDEYLKARKS